MIEYIAEGLVQVQLPLPFALRSVNCYLLQDEDGWALIDAGLHTHAAEQAWQAALHQLDISPASITRIILTHAHPDHYGMAGWFAEQSGASVHLSAAEQRFVQTVWHDGEPAYHGVRELFLTNGMPADLAEAVYTHMAALRAMTQPWPATSLLEPGTSLQIGPRSFHILMTPGHSDGHVVLFSAEERLLLCGDAVLAKITPNVGRWPYGGANPLADFLQSLTVLATLDVALALPGHGKPIIDMQGRLAELKAHHDARLQLVEQAAGIGATAFAVCTSIFPMSNLSPHEIRFAMAETLAHLDYLVAVGRLERANEQYFLPTHRD